MLPSIENCHCHCHCHWQLAGAGAVVVGRVGLTGVLGDPRRSLISGDLVQMTGLLCQGMSRRSPRTERTCASEAAPMVPRSADVILLVLTTVQR